MRLNGAAACEQHAAGTPAWESRHALLQCPSGKFFLEFVELTEKQALLF